MTNSHFKSVFGMALAISLVTPQAKAFSLIGPYENWMTETNGYRQPGDIGGPMNSGDEYRWNVPVVTYSFNANFVDCFGSNGVAAVDSAIQILNDLPPVSQINLDDYPTDTTGVNYQARAEELYDLKSRTLSTLLEQLGLAQPTRYTYCVRNVLVGGGSTNVSAIMRNYDPDTWVATNAVNGTVLTYYTSIQNTGSNLLVDAVELVVDPLDRAATAVADGSLMPGTYYTGLTRDDVGGLRYLLSTNNVNYEELPVDVHGTNGINSVRSAFRPGVDKITFVRRDYDSLLGAFFQTFTNQFTDVYVVSNVVFHQQVERIVEQPDFLFDAADLGNNSPPILVSRTGTTNWLADDPPLLPGPGVIRPLVKITFNKSAPYVRTSDDWPEGTADIVDIRWGSFDGSTNAPVRYPIGSQVGSSTVHLHLKASDSQPEQSFTWEVQIPSGGVASLETSTNLADWVPVAEILDPIVDWEHIRSCSQRYFRVVPK